MGSSERNGNTYVYLGFFMTVVSSPRESETTSAAQRGLLRRARIFGFPAAINFWPLLLFVSQKAFVIPGMLLLGFGDRKYRQDVAIAFTASICAIVVYLTQFSNSYAQVHLIGFLLFIWSVPILNHSVRFDPIGLMKVLTYFTLFNCLMAFALLVSNVDLYGLRGLNRIVGTDGETHRIYFESASLIAVILATTFTRRSLQVIVIVLSMFFLLFITRSVALIFLFVLNLSMPYLMKSTPLIKTITLFSGLLFLYLLYIYLPVIRPDIELSLRAKQFQLDLIVGTLDGWSGLGWGAFLPALASDPDQPYQIEMQLPMLLLQIGPLALTAISGLIWMLFGNCSKGQWLSTLRFCIFMVIGFNNPWIFLPSWFLTCQLLFRYQEAK